MAQLTIKNRTAGDVTILDLSGKITIGVGDVALRDAVRSALDAGATKVLVNMADVTGLDSSGVGELVSSYTSTRSRGAQLKLVNLPAKVRDILHITQLITVFETYEDEKEAVASFR